MQNHEVDEHPIQGILDTVKFRDKSELHPSATPAQHVVHFASPYTFLIVALIRGCLISEVRPDSRTSCAVYVVLYGPSSGSNLKGFKTS